MDRQLRLELGRSTPFRRADFIVSSANADAVRALDAWPNWHGGCLTLVGPAGSGKSHLALTWAAHAHAAAATAHGKGDHLTAHELSKQAHEHSMNANKLVEELDTKAARVQQKPK